MTVYFTAAGKAITANRVKGTGTEPNYGAWGTGAVAASATSTTLSTEASESRVAGTSSVVTTTVTNDTYQVVVTITAAGAKTITNAGLLDASTSGNLYLIADAMSQLMAANDSIQFTWQNKYA